MTACASSLGAVAARAGREFQVAVVVLAGAAGELAPAMPLVKAVARHQELVAVEQIQAPPAVVTTGA